LSTRNFLGSFPQATVVCIDHFQGSPEHQADPEWREMLPTLYESFLTLNWPSRERIVPLRMTIQEGMRTVARYGLKPEVIFFDADHSYENLLADLELAHELFPQAQLIGDDFDAPQVAQAANEFSRRHGDRIQSFGNSWHAWRLMATQQDALAIVPPNAAPASGEHAPPAASGRASPAADAVPCLLSAIMIVRDNERTIRAALDSIRPWVGEIIVVDTGSQDRTPEICRELGAKVFHFPWPDSFSGARNESLRHARGQWVFWMDSDDTIPAECGRKLRELVLVNVLPEVFC
jgi:hypothetical protein